MDLRRLRYFQAVAGAGSLSRASRSVGIAQPALGRQMQLLEESLGVKLFIRMPKGMILTDEGRFLHNALNRPMNELAIALRSVRTYAKSVEASINVGMYTPISRLLGSEVVKRLQADNPNITVRFFEEKASRLRSDLENGVIDIAITYGSPSGTNFEMLAIKEPLFLLAREDSDANDLGSIGLEDLARIPLVLDRDPGFTAATLQKMLGRLGESMMVSHEVDSMPIIVEMVRSGSTCSVVTHSDILYENISGLNLIPISESDASREVYYAVRQHWHIPMPVYSAFHQTLFGVWQGLVDEGRWQAEWIGKGHL